MLKADGVGRVSAGLPPALGLFACMATPLAAQQHLDATLLWERGGELSNEHADWIEITSGSIGDQVVVVVDARVPAIGSFTLDGEFIAEIGRPGQGPGEFERPGGVSIVADTLRVSDFLQRRWSYFMLDGRHLRTTRDGFPDVPLRWGLETEPGTWVGETAWVSSGEEASIQQALVTWRDGASVDTIARYAQNHAMFQWEGIPGWRSTHVSLGASGDAAVLGDSAFVVLDGLEGRYHVVRARGERWDTVRVQELGATGALMDAQDHPRIQAMVFEELGGRHPRWEEELLLPERWSAWTAVADGRDGTIWVRRGGEEYALGRGGEEWHRIIPLTGEQVGILSVGPSERVLDFHADRVLTAARDELGVESLRLYSLTETGG